MISLMFQILIIFYSSVKAGRAPTMPPLTWVWVTPAPALTTTEAAGPPATPWTRSADPVTTLIPGPPGNHPTFYRNNRCTYLRCSYYVSIFEDVNADSNSGLANWQWAIIGTGAVLVAVATLSLGSRLLSSCAAGVARCRRALGQLTAGPTAVPKDGLKPNPAADPVLIDLESRERNISPP